MAAAVRISPLLFLWLFAYLACVLVDASPVALNHTSVLLPRSNTIVKEVNGKLQIFSASNGQSIPQGPASDGSGSGLGGPAILWIGFLSVIGLPLSLAGIKGWRLTTGAGIGLAFAVCSWAAFINSVNDVGIPDLILSLIIIAFFALGFIIGLFEIGRIAGLALLGITGGMAFGIPIVLLKRDLLIPIYFVNWFPIALFGIAGGVLILFRRRAGIVLCSASAGIFLSSLALDLLLYKQSGLSRGLRFLFDRNSSHLADILTNGYKPPLGTQINLGVSLLLTPLLAYAQHKFFSQPFSRKPADEVTIPDFFEGRPSPMPFRSRFSL